MLYYNLVIIILIPFYMLVLTHLGSMCQLDNNIHFLQWWVEPISSQL